MSVLRLLLRTLGFFWSLPVTLIGLSVAGFLGPREGEIRAGCLWIEVHRLPFGFRALTLGRVICWTSLTAERERHELVHVLQCDIFGPLALLIYPAAMLVAAIQGGDWHRDNVMERWARGELA